MADTRKTVIPQTVFEETDENGTVYTVLDKQGRAPDVTVFFNNGLLMVRQESIDCNRVDMLEMTLGQTNDLLMAPSKALEIPVRIY